MCSPERLVAVAERAGARTAVNFPFATLPGIARIEQDLRTGAIGPIERVEILLHFSQWPRTWHHAGEWLSGREQGGFLREVFSHFAYLTQRLIGPLSIVHSDVDFPASGTESRVNAELESGGVPVTLVGGAGGAAPDYNQWTVYGQDRSYRLVDWSQLTVSNGERWEDGPSEELGSAPGQLDELARLLDGEASVLPDLRVGLEVQRVVEGLLA